MGSKDAIPPIMDVHQLVLKAIQSGKFDEVGEDSLIEETRKEYFLGLKRAGIPFRAEDKEAVDREIRDTVKAIIYGHFSIKEFNGQKKIRD